MAFTTERLEVSAASEADIADIFASMSELSTIRNVAFMRQPMTVAQAADWIGSSTLGGKDRLVARSVTEHRIVGCIGLWVDSRKTELVYWIVEAKRRQRLGSELVEGAVTYATESLSLRNLWATTALDNEGSIRILESQGFCLEQQVCVRMADGTDRLSHLYELPGDGRLSP